LALAFLFWRFVLSALPTSLWIDETGTFWVTNGDFQTLWARINETQFPQMPLFALLIWAWRQLFGSSEWVLRIPSVLAFLGATALLWKISRRLFPQHPSAPWYALIIYFSFPFIPFAASDARAYSIALLFLIWCFLERLNTLDSPSIWPFLRHGLAAGLSMHFCYFYGAALAGDFAFVLWLSTRRKRFDLRHLLSPLAALVVFSPLLPLLRVVLRESASHVSSTFLPSFRDLGAEWAPQRFVLACFTALLIALWVRRDSSFALLTDPESPGFAASRSVTRAHNWPLLAFWAFAPAAILYGYSMATGRSIFIDRYLSSQAPGLALLLTAVTLSLAPALWRHGLIAMLFLVTATSGGKSLWRLHKGEDWRGAAQIATSYTQKHADAKFVAASCFIEGLHFPMPVTPTQDLFLRSYLLPYKFPPNPQYFPMGPIGIAAEIQQPTEEILSSLKQQPRVLFLTIAEPAYATWLDGFFHSTHNRVVLTQNPRLVAYERKPVTSFAP
jgi:4-amino-4-deoxy-L-arabinose transferase-like glycosyltransferase